MELTKFLKQEIEAPKAKISWMLLISGVANGLLLAMINAGADNAWSQKVEERIFVMYIIAFLLYVYTTRYAYFQAVMAFEGAIRKMRLRLAEKIRNVEVPFIENTGYSGIYIQLTDGSNTVSQSALYIISAGQSFIVLVACLLYIGWLSFLAFVLITAMLGSWILWYVAIDKQIRQKLLQASLKEKAFFKLLTQMLEGFKELKINQRKSDDLFQDMDTTSTQHEQLKSQVGVRTASAVMSSRMIFYPLLALMVFVMPTFEFLQSNIILKLTASTLFIVGPVNMIVYAFPMLARANVALKDIYSLEAELDAVISKQSRLPTTQLDQFQELRLSEVAFSYLDKEGKPLFSVGPINLSIPQGELLFLVGGNGSGKSTLLKLLTGLYYPMSGSLWVADEEIDRREYQSYRELFAIIFTDFHLFEKLYGLREIDRKRVKSWLRLVELDKKTEYLDRKFSHLDLSTGQKKRLAFVVAMLEEKPVYVFDELAADQDPGFRKKFYEEILPDLKKQGKTIIVVTHDDKYFHTADRILKMEYGQLVNYEGH
jgi:putative ATP-binding cassette transporter